MTERVQQTRRKAPLPQQTPEQMDAPVATEPLSVQRQALMKHGARPQAAQRYAAGPVLRAASLDRQEHTRLDQERAHARRQVAALGEVAAVGRQADPLPVPDRPTTPAEWVTVMRARAEEVQGRPLDSRSSAAFTALQRQVAQTLAQGFRSDRGDAQARYATYGEHLATLQRHPVSAPVARVVLGLIPSAERLPLQRAVDETLQRFQAQEQAALNFDTLQTLQRQLAELDADATQPVLARIQARRGSGNPLPEAIQRHLEQGLNHDLSRVRIHDDAEADKLAKGVNAIAFTTGTDIFFQSGQFNPNTQSGLELLAHEVTHTVQQSQGKVGQGIDPDAGLESEAQAMGQRLARQPLSPSKAHRRPIPQRATFTPTTTFQRRPATSPLQPPALQTVGKVGVIRHSDGANLREKPGPQGKVILPAPLPVGTKVGVVHQTADGWSRITLTSGKSGYVQSSRVTTNLPDPGAMLVKVSAGATAIGIAERHYKGVVRPGQDLRYYVNVLRYLDGQRGTGAFLNDQKLKGGSLLWVPSPVYAQTLVGVVKSGSITGGAVATANAALGNSPGANIMRSVLESPQYIKEVLGESWNAVKAHWPAILATTVALVSAELLVGVLAALPEPTTISKFLAMGLQSIIVLVAGGSAVLAAGAAVSAGQKWLTAAWTAKGNASKLKVASKAFLSMIGHILAAVASAAGVRGSVRGLNAPASMVTKQALTARIGSPQIYTQLMQRTGGNTKFLSSLLDYGFKGDEILGLLNTEGATVSQVQAILAAAQKHGVGIDDFRNEWAFKKPTMEQLKKWAFGWPKDDGFIVKPIDIKLQPGTLIDRYGAPTGRFVSPAGPSFGARALASPEGYENYYLYEVLKPLDVKSGAASPWFGEAGGATQYTLPGKIEELIEQGALRQVKVVPGTKK